ncbi:MAG: beta-ketoacyl synthase N-terminal-like domain-containing protein, partial [Desulfobulbales bacterium]
MRNLADQERIVITGVGLAAPNASSLPEFRAKLLAGKSEIRKIALRYMPHPSHFRVKDALA